MLMKHIRVFVPDTKNYSNYNMKTTLKRQNFLQKNFISIIKKHEFANEVF